jgi:hypothetical protein
MEIKGIGSNLIMLGIFVLIIYLFFNYAFEKIMNYIFKTSS